MSLMSTINKHAYAVNMDDSDSGSDDGSDDSSGGYALFHALADQADSIKQKLTDAEYKSLMETVAKAREANTFYKIEYVWTSAEAVPTLCDDCSGAYEPPHMVTHISHNTRICRIGNGASTAHNIHYRSTIGERAVENIIAAVASNGIHTQINGNDHGYMIITSCKLL